VQGVEKEFDELRNFMHAQVLQIAEVINPGILKGES
jgi:hypothetical protein